jgi:toluene monooxygenase system ferredoxin subunit|tara:strand:- start:1361 stop:1699 length:339 start_codon:yes stop_codon:yes gene_type:complete
VIVSDDLQFQKVCEVDDVWEGEMELFDVNGNEVLIVHSPGMEIRAFSPICPHQEFSLFDGELENCVLTCSAHLWQFDVRTGEGVNPTGTSLTSYPMRVEDNAIWVAFPEQGK